MAVPAGAESRWSRRRTALAAALAPLLFLGLVNAGGGWPPLDAPLWTGTVGLVAAAAAAALATYLPLHGWRPQLGCGPCAAMPAMTVLAAVWFLGTAPHQLPIAVLALTVVTFGLVQRLTGAGAACPTRD